ncbi:MAG: hypothetical protein RIS75_397 [Actinomycetota bacterium]|jgi:hypothetical protein
MNQPTPPAGDEPTQLAGVHRDIAHMSWLVGTWTGFGEGQYPTTEAFRYEEVVQFATDGRPFLEYRSMTWIVDEDNKRIKPAHTESGYWRPAPDNGIEALIAHPLGYSELWLGQVEVTELVNARITGARLTMHADAIIASPTAKSLQSGTRMYGLVNGELLMTYDMGAVDQPHTNHLAIRMARA